MDPEEFRKHGKEMIDYVADYWSTIRDRKPLPDIKPGYLSQLVPSHPPSAPEDWSAIFADLESVVLQGVTNWHHPNFHAYFPTALSYQAIMGDILSGGISAIGFTWKSCPSMTELEMTTLDWLVESLGLPEHFKNSAEGPGCGIIQSTASDATHIAIMTARAKAVENVKTSEASGLLGRLAASDVGKTVKNLLARVRQNTIEEKDSDLILPHFHDPTVFEKLVAYCSDQAHSSVEKGVMLCGVRLRKLKSTRDEKGNFTVTVEDFEKAIKEDVSKGLIPFIMIATMGTTNSCSFDHLEQLGPICKREHIWLHCDAAYAGSFLLCPEFRYMSTGIEYCDSFNFNAHKGMLINFDCSPMWFADGTNAARYFTVDPLYLKHEHQAVASDYRHLQIALGRRFRSLKIWFVLRNIGVEALQNHLKKQNQQAVQFSDYIESSDEFELFAPQHLGLVCFRIKDSTDEDNEALCNAINEDRRIHLVPSKVHGKFFLRLAVCSQLTTSEDIRTAYEVIREIHLTLKK
ncbi:unnamed protein product [Auanema sp. JU1783]|nr:unnamed protein product [Auanema sp. JU1783]